MAISHIWFAVGTLALLLVSVFADVVVLTKVNFHKEVGQDRGALVEFYAPWCGHCLKLAPEYEKLGANLKKTKTVLVGKVDCDEHKSLCSKYEVTIYPTIHWFPKGSLEPKKYQGLRTAESLAEFVNNDGGTNEKIATSPSNVVVLAADNFDEFVLDESKDVLVKFYAPWCGHCKNLAPTYEKVATAFKMEDDVVIAKLDADKYKDLAEKYGVSGYPTLKFFPKNNKAGEEYDGGRDLDDFVTFINEKCGTSRDGKGQLTSKDAIITSLDALVKEFRSAGNDGKKAFFSKLEEVVETLKGARYGKIYLGTLSLLKELVSARNDEKKALFSKLEEEVVKLKGSTARYGKIYLEATISLLKELVSTGNEEKKALFSKLEDEVEKLKGSAARNRKIYLEAAKSSMEKGSFYAKNEIERLQRMLGKDS